MDFGISGIFAVDIRRVEHGLISLHPDQGFGTPCYLPAVERAASYCHFDAGGGAHVRLCYALAMSYDPSTLNCFDVVFRAYSSVMVIYGVIPFIVNEIVRQCERGKEVVATKAS